MKDEMKKIITGIDVGTTKVCVIIASHSEDKQLEILGVGKSKNTGMKKGVVININDTVESIQSAVEEAEKQAGVQVNEAFVGISGEHIRGINNTGIINVAKSTSRVSYDYVITEADKLRVLEHAQNISLPSERRILHVLSQEYKVDNRREVIANPVGMTGNRLEAKVHLVHCEIASEKNLAICLEKAGIDVIDFVLSPLASSYAVLDPNERKMGVVLLDIGGGTTDVMVFLNGGVHHIGIIPVGGEAITSDIAHGAQTTLEQAEKLKCKYGIAKEALASPDDEITVVGIRGRDSRTLSTRNLAAFIEPRIREIMMFALTEIRKSDRVRYITFGIVLTGGSALMNNIKDLAQDIFPNWEVKIGAPILSGGLSDTIQDPVYSTAIGLIQYAIENEDRYSVPDGLPGVLKSVSDKIKNLFGKLY